jgi:hypothetical protein
MRGEPRDPPKTREPEEADVRRAEPDPSPEKRESRPARRPVRDYPPRPKR